MQVRGLHSFKGEGSRVRRIVKDLKWNRKKRKNLQSNEKATRKIA